MIKVGNAKVIPFGIKKVTFGSNVVYEDRNYLKFTASGGSAWIQWFTSDGTTTGLEGIKYSKDGNIWNNWDANTQIKLNEDEYMYVKNTGNTLSTDSRVFRFDFAGIAVKASGNLLSMINFSNLTPYCFMELFKDGDRLLTPPQLPSTKLEPLCYANMFYGCTRLEKAPVLPASSLKDSCYLGMFYNCSSLTTAPVLPANSLAISCYQFMFHGCSGLYEAPKLPSMMLENSCYNNMFSNCGNLHIPPTLNSEELKPNCYKEMFKGCNNLSVSDGTEGTAFFTCPTSSYTTATTDMFTGTGGSFAGTPVAGNTYRWY